MPNIPIHTGLLSNVLDLIPDLPGPVDNLIRDAVGTAVAVIDPAVPTPPPAEQTAPVPAENKNDVVEAIDTAISAIGVLLRFRFLVPDQFEGPLDLLVKALQLVRTWVD